MIQMLYVKQASGYLCLMRMKKQIYERQQWTRKGRIQRGKTRSLIQQQRKPLVQVQIRKDEQKRQITQRPLAKQKMIKQIRNQLLQKLSMDQQVKVKLYRWQQEALGKQRRIQVQLEQINKQNQRWIGELNRFYKIVQNRKQSLKMDRQMKEQQQLIEEYRGLLDQEQRIKRTRSYRGKLQKINWSEIALQKQKITHVLRQNEKKLRLLVRSRTGDVQKPKQDEGECVQQKPIFQLTKIHKVRNTEQLKQLGRIYLQFAKKAQKSRSQRKLLKLQNKNIDYAKEMKQLIKLKVDDLSKALDVVGEDTLNSRRKKLLRNTLVSTGSLRLSSNQSLLKLKKNKENSQQSKPKQNKA